MFTTLALIVVALYLLYKWAHPKPISNIPYNAAALNSFFGDLPAMIRDTKANNQTHMDWIVQQMRSLDSPVIQLFLSPLQRPTVILADFRETQDIMIRRKEFDRSTNIRGLLEDVIPDHHIYQQTNAVFRTHRKLVQDVMLPSFIREVAGPAFHGNIMRLVQLWEMKTSIADGSPFCATLDIQGAVLDAVYSFAFGENYKSSTTLPNIALLQNWRKQGNRKPTGIDQPFIFPEVAFDELISATIDLAKAPQGIQGSPIAKWVAKIKMNMPHFRKVRKIRDDFLIGCIQSSVSKIESDEKFEVTSAVEQMVLRETTLAKSEGRSPNHFSSMMQGELFGLILGGFDTTSTTTLWGLKFLTDNPSVQQRLREILQSSFAEAKGESRSPSFRELAAARIPYLEAVIEEILRCAGATPALQRVSTVDTQILGYHIPKGTDVLFLTHGPSVWSPGFGVDESRRSQTSQVAGEKKDQSWEAADIAHFKPERWLVAKTLSAEDMEEIEEFDGTAGPTLAFGLGTRGCFGRRLGYQQLKTSIAMLCLTYLVAVVVYNLFFHPLRHFPGPWLNRITQIPHTLLMLCGLPHKKHLELHLKYGPVVRIGPNMLSFNHPDAMKDVRGHRKAGEAEHGKDPISVQFAGDNIVGSDRENHTRFRRALAYGFSAQAMLEQEPTFKSYVNQLFRQLHERSSGGKKVVDISKWYTFTTFDMIGDLAFGESFGCLDNSTYHPWVALAFESLKSVAFLAEIGRYPGVAPLAGFMLPRGLLTKFAENKELASMKVRKRLDTKTDRPDFVGKITQGLKSKGSSMEFDELASNASVLIVAGSETTATLLSAAVYFLCANPRTLGLLTHEVRTTYAKAEDIDLVSTQNLRYMQAVLDEALRMYPPVAGGGSPRQIAKGGSLVAGYYVPENTLVENDMWAMHYDPKYFTQPHDFIPERWLSDPRFKDDRLDAVKPFSIGPRNCIGMNLAYAEMRMMLARTVWEFDLRLTEDSRNWYDESRVYLAWHKPPLNVYLIPR